MKRILFAAFCLGVLLSYFLAFKAGDAGVAVSIGGPTGVTGQTRLRAAGGYRDNLWYSWMLLPPSAGRKLPGYHGPAAPGGSPAKPSGAMGKKEVRGQNTVKRTAGLPEKKEAEKSGHRRKKRVSRLQEPGEAMGGGVNLSVSTRTTGSARRKK